jgi:hypothetical protein
MRKLAILLVLELAAIAAFAQAVPHSTKLTWGASTSTGALYNVYKDHGCTGTFTKLTSAPLQVLTFTDIGQADGDVNCYYVSAIVGTAESTQAQSTTIRVVTPTVTPPTATLPPGTVSVASQ